MVSAATPTNNVDPSEIERFNALASRWWDPTGDMAPLHAMNPARLAFVMQHAALHGLNVLDVGCGGGLLSEAMAKSHAQVTGLDMAESLIDVARLHALSEQVSVDYVHQRIEDWAQAHPNKHDVVTCMEMLEHVPDPAQIIRSINHCLKPGGMAFFSTLNRTPAAFAIGIVGAEYIMRLLPTGTHQYDQFIKPSELAECARGHGFDVVDVQGLIYNPLTQKAFLGKNTAINYLMAVRKPEVSH